MTIIFICTGNSCRSQIAEGFSKNLFGSNFIIQSCGFRPETINQFAIDVMSEVGIDISEQSSKMIDEDLISGADIVITLCGDALDRCYNLISSKQHIHWQIPDPAKVTGSDDEVREEFRVVRDLIKSNIIELKKKIEVTNDK